MPVRGDFDRQLPKFVLRIALYMFIGRIVLSMHPFGIGARTDEATQDAFYRVASLEKPVVTYELRCSVSADVELIKRCSQAKEN